MSHPIPLDAMVSDQLDIVRPLGTYRAAFRTLPLSRCVASHCINEDRRVIGPADSLACNNEPPSSD